MAFTFGKQREKLRNMSKLYGLPLEQQWKYFIYSHEHD